MKNIRFKKVLRWSKGDRIYRLFRIMWIKGDGPGIHLRSYGGGKHYSAKLSIALRPSLNFLRVKLHRSYGGLHV